MELVTTAALGSGFFLHHRGFSSSRLAAALQAEDTGQRLDKAAGSVSAGRFTDGSSGVSLFSLFFPVLLLASFFLSSLLVR